MSKKEGVENVNLYFVLKRKLSEWVVACNTALRLFFGIALHHGQG
jgi:hypothetical protein